MKGKSGILWVLRLLPAVILLQTLFYKFSAAEESVYIFSVLGLEPYGRIGIGILELVTGILLVVPRTTWLGAILGLGIMAGAIFAHLTKLGIEVLGDSGLLFFLALVVASCCSVIIWLSRKEIPYLRNVLP